jgi:hypothetical protein
MVSPGEIPSRLYYREAGQPRSKFASQFTSSPGLNLARLEVLVASGGVARTRRHCARWAGSPVSRTGSARVQGGRWSVTNSYGQAIHPTTTSHSIQAACCVLRSRSADSAASRTSWSGRLRQRGRHRAGGCKSLAVERRERFLVWRIAGAADAAHPCGRDEAGWRGLRAERWML